MRTIAVFVVLAVAFAQGELVTEEATFDITMGGQPAGQIKIGLFGQTVPKTVRNFATICNPGINGKSYAGSAFHRVIRNFMLQGGDIIRGDGTGSTSIYGGRFEDENFNIKHTGPGFLSMANSGPNTNGCQFFITAVATPWLDGHHVVFGRVVDGLKLVKTIENSPTGANDRPQSPVVIQSCSLRKLEQPYDLPLNHEKNYLVYFCGLVPILTFSLIVIRTFQKYWRQLDDSCCRMDQIMEDATNRAASGDGDDGEKQDDNNKEKDVITKRLIAPDPGQSVSAPDVDPAKCKSE